MFVCFHCQAPWESTLRQPAVKETCDQCGAYLHCCKNCRFHRRGYPNACYIPDTEKIADKQRANFCDEFEFRPVNADPAEASRNDSSKDLWGEETTGAPGKKADAGIEAWLLETEKPAKDFDDLFDS
jgi:hypothetical protein